MGDHAWKQLLLQWLLSIEKGTWEILVLQSPFREEGALQGMAQSNDKFHHKIQK